TRNVWIVSPTYMLLFRILDDAGLHHKLRAVPEDDEGIDIEYLRRELEKSEQKARTEGNNHPVSTAIRFVTLNFCVRKPSSCNSRPQSQIGHAMISSRTANHLKRSTNPHGHGRNSTNISSMPYRPSQTPHQKPCHSSDGNSSSASLE